MPAPTPTAPEPPIATTIAVAPDTLEEFTLTLLSFAASSLSFELSQPNRVELLIRASVLSSNTFTATPRPTATAPDAPTASTPFNAPAADSAFTFALPAPVKCIFELSICAATERCNQLKFTAAPTPTVPDAPTLTTRENMPFCTLNRASIGSTLCVAPLSFFAAFNASTSS